MIKGYYFNVMSDGVLKKHEKNSLALLKARGYDLEHMPIDWYNDKPLGAIVEGIASSIQRLDDSGPTLLLGASAGGSMALNVFLMLKDQNVRLVTVCSRLNEVPLKWWDWRTLKRMSNKSLLFRTSVENVTAKVIPALNKNDLVRISSVVSSLDELVPRNTMKVPGTRSIEIRSFGHRNGLKKGMQQVPRLSDIG